MPYRNMSLEDFARYVGMDAREVSKQADRGLLPAVKVGGQWRFNSARVTEWLQQEMGNLDAGRLKALDRAMAECRADEAEQLLLTGHMGVEGIDLNLSANTKASVLRELVRLAERTGLLYDAKDLLEAVIQREELCSTALEMGIAIPHPRQLLPYVSAEPLLCFARLPRGIPFGAVDRALTDLFFLIVSHEDRHHLQVLARLVRVLDEDTIHGLRAAVDSAEALAILIEREQRVIGSTK